MVNGARGDIKVRCFTFGVAVGHRCARECSWDVVERLLMSGNGGLMCLYLQERWFGVLLYHCVCGWWLVGSLISFTSTRRRIEVKFVLLTWIVCQLE